jgi:hypothetical protein
VNRDEALKVLFPLGSNFREFDSDDKAELWIEMMRDVTDFSVAMDASREAVKFHTWSTITYGEWFAIYQRLAGRNVIDLHDRERRRLGTGRRPMTLVEYLDGWLVPMERGELDKGDWWNGDTLEDWRRLADRQVAHAEAVSRDAAGPLRPAGPVDGQMRLLPAWFAAYDKETADG